MKEMGKQNPRIGAKGIMIHVDERANLTDVLEDRSAVGCKLSLS